MEGRATASESFDFVAQDDNVFGFGEEECLPKALRLGRAGVEKRISPLRCAR